MGHNVGIFSPTGILGHNLLGVNYFCRSTTIILAAYLQVDDLLITTF
jgi:hypothetical protein